MTIYKNKCCFVLTKKSIPVSYRTFPIEFAQLHFYFNLLLMHKFINKILRKIKNRTKFNDFSKLIGKIGVVSFAKIRIKDGSSECLIFHEMKFSIIGVTKYVTKGSIT